MNKDLFCLLGNPVDHSVSPAMHNAAFRDLGIHGIYTTMLVKDGELENSISALRGLNVRGINVTMPFKEEVIKFIDGIDTPAREVRAVNTIVNENGKLIGYNTDILGGVEAVLSVINDLKGKKAVILGKGGAGRALSYGLGKQGMKTLTLGRTEMVEDNLAVLIDDADLICNCTPLGMTTGFTPVPKRLLRKKMVIFDAVYGNGVTDLIRDAKEMGCRTVDGLRMLVDQGASSLKLWMGIEPNREVMLKAANDGIKKIRDRKWRNIYFVGFMGTGKSSVGAKVADILKRKFVDTDLEISTQTGLPISGIFKNLGEQEFRRIERDEIEKSCRESGLVVSPGGGSVLNFENVSEMKEHGSIILLKANANTIYSRVKAEYSRPLLEGENGGIDNVKLLNEMERRAPYYLLARDIEIVTDDKSIETVAREVIQKMEVVG